jgi:hypothetical protein
MVRFGNAMMPAFVHKQIKTACPIALADVLAKFPHRIELGEIKLCEIKLWPA